MKATIENNDLLITVEDALNTILEKITPVEAQTVPLAQSFGRILAEPIVSQINVPPFANSAMDGYAILAADSQGASRQSPVLLKVTDNVPAGAVPTRAISSKPRLGL